MDSLEGKGARRGIETTMKRIVRAVWDVLSTIHKGKPGLVTLCLVLALLSGVSSPLFLWANSQVLDLGLAVAQNKMSFQSYIPYLTLFGFCILFPQLICIILQSYVEPASALILRTSFKGTMLQKLKTMKFEHLEIDESVEIIDKTYSRAEEATLHIFPSYFFRLIASLLASIGTLYMFTSIRWWFLLTIILPFFLDTILSTRTSFNIYDEMESYWERERNYKVLGDMLKTRQYLRENKLFQSGSFLIQAYKNRMHARNKEFERFYFKNLKYHFRAQCISKASQLLNAILLLLIYNRGGLDIGQLLAMTISVFTTLGNALAGCRSVIGLIGYQVKFFEYYERYFELSDDNHGTVEQIPAQASIEFCNVSFSYPGCTKQILSHLSFTINPGEKVAFVGKNGEGKTTIVKLLLGLYQPDEGCIRIGGIPLNDFTYSAKTKLFAPVFQDFVKYDISLKENVGIGDQGNLDNKEYLMDAMKKAKVTSFAESLPDGIDTLLGRHFEGSTDLSGGQWQRIAIARAFMGNKSVMVLDEPTSQLDPMAESEIYSDFAEMANGKTTIFITHRLGATTIADKIFVIENGRVTQSGTHDQLLKENGLYADMFQSQKQWYMTNVE